MNQVKLLLISLSMIFCSKIALANDTATTASHLHTFPDGKSYYVILNVSGPSKLTGNRSGKISINSESGVELGFANFELGYINPMLDVLTEDDSGSLKTLYVDMMNTQSAPPNGGKLLVAYLAKLAGSEGLPVTLASAWGSGIFWAKMGFVFTKPSVMIDTYPDGRRKAAVKKLSISHFLDELEDALDSREASSLNQRLVMSKVILDQWNEMSKEDLQKLQFPELNYEKAYIALGAAPEQAKRVADKLKKFKK